VIRPIGFSMISNGRNGFVEAVQRQVREIVEPKANVLNFHRNMPIQIKRALDLYRQGDFKLALSESISLINQGFADANVLAGAIYERGGHGIQQDFQKAFFYYQRAVHEVGAVEGWLALGRFYYLGKGIDTDYEAARECYSVVEEDAAHPVAHLMLGRMHHEGKGVPKDINLARAYYQRAANKGAVFGVSYLGSIELESGNIIYGVWLRFKAALMGLLIWIKNRNDSRLRRA